MPRGLRNWTFEDIVTFLKDNGFKACEGSHAKKSGSHHFFERNKDGEDYLVHIQYHAGKTIPIGTMKAIVSTSGISQRKWRGL